MSLGLSSDQMAFLAREANAALPNECCGLIEGVRGELRVVRFHPSHNLSPRPNESFEIDPALQISLMRALRGTECGIVGCYHSHPGGACEPSAHDAAGASEESFLWLIVSPEDGQTKIGAYIWKAGAFARLPLFETQNSPR